MLILPETWFRPVLGLVNAPTVETRFSEFAESFSTFHLEYPTVLPRFSLIFKHVASFFFTLLGKSESQVALRWLLQKDIVPSVIIGCTTLKQLEENCAAASGWKLTKEQVTSCWRLDDTTQSPWCHLSYDTASFR